jgi:hypothetical protein
MTAAGQDRGNSVNNGPGGPPVLRTGEYAWLVRPHQASIWNLP